MTWLLWVGLALASVALLYRRHSPRVEIGVVSADLSMVVLWIYFITRG